MSDDYDSEIINTLPNFIPPDKQVLSEENKEVSREADQLVREVDQLVEAGGIEEGTAQPEQKNIEAKYADRSAIPDPELDYLMEDDGIEDPEPQIGDLNLDDPKVQAAILAMADRINQSQIKKPEDEQVQIMRQLLERSQQGLVNGRHGEPVGLVDGLASVVSSSVGAIGGAVDVISSGLKAAARSFDGKSPNPLEENIQILPRISEYRVGAIEKAAAGYQDAVSQFWQSGSMPDVKREIEERARVTGVSVNDVIEKMKPGGEMADLHEKFVQAFVASPNSGSQKKNMDKALEAWGRQYSRGQEELLNPETKGLPQYEGIRDRLLKSKEAMERSSSEVPLFDGEEKSHAERLKEIMAHIAEKIKEFLERIGDVYKARHKEALSDAHP